MATTSGAPYQLRLPQDGDVADIPGDLANLATDLHTALNTKLQRSSYTPPGGSEIKGADTLYQTKIEVLTSVPSSGAGYTEGTIIFVVAP